MTKDEFIKYYVDSREKQAMLESLSQLYDKIGAEIEKRDAEYRRRIVALLDKAIKRDKEIEKRVKEIAKWREKWEWADGAVGSHKDEIRSMENQIKELEAKVKYLGGR